MLLILSVSFHSNPSIVSQVTVEKDPKYRKFADHSKCSESLNSALHFGNVLIYWEADWFGRMHRTGNQE